MYDEVELLDIHSVEKLEVKQENKQIKPFRTTKPSAFGNQPKTLKRKRTKTRKPPKTQKAQDIKQVSIPDDIRVYEFADKCGKTTSEIMSILFGLGMMVTKNDFLSKDEIEILAEEFEVEVTTINPLDELDYVAAYDAIEDETLEERPPVITIMGHVDHGKTSLLDKIRSAKVAAKEAGGITQHVGAYQVEKNGKKITFVDTPGHEAFTSLRERGGSIADLAILVIDINEGFKPQTVESIKILKQAKTPFVVAAN